MQAMQDPGRSAGDQINHDNRDHSAIMDALGPKAEPEKPREANQPMRPIGQTRLGNINVAIWENEGKNGSWNTLTVSRSYRAPDGQMRSTQSLRVSDLLVASRALEKTFDRLQEKKTASQDDPEEEPIEEDDDDERRFEASSG